MIDRIDGRILNVLSETDGSAVVSDAFVGDSTLSVDDATDFHERGGKLVLHDGSKITYDSADMDADTVTLTDPLVIDVPEGTFVKTYPIAAAHWAEVDIFGYDEATLVRVPHHYWPWLKLGARTEDEQELVTVVYDGQDWTVFDVKGTAVPQLSDAHATRERIFRYTSEGIAADGYKGVKLTEEHSGNAYQCRVKSATAVTGSSVWKLLRNGAVVGTMTIPAGSQFSPMVAIDEDFDNGDRFRIEFTDPSDATANVVVWVYARLNTD